MRWVSYFYKIDWPIIGSIFLLTVLGLASIAGSAPGQFKKQALFVILGFALLAVLIFLSNHKKISYRVLQNYTLSLYLLAILLLGSVLVFGSLTRGSTSWFDLGFLAFQPVEIVKLLLIIVLAKMLCVYHLHFHRLRTVFLSGFYTIIPVFLTLRQPDLGSAVVLIFIWLGMLIAAGLPWRQLIALLLIGLTLFVLAWFVFLRPYQKSRFLAFLNPEADPLGYGYNIIQSLIAVGSGGLSGKGLGFGSQTQLGFLPVSHTDFIFASLAEEMGFLGAGSILFLFGLLFYRFVKIILQARDNFARLLGVGVVIFLGTHVLINLGMNIGLLPIIGISLPFVSYGGSHLLACFLAVALMENIKMNS